MAFAQLWRRIMQSRRMRARGECAGPHTVTRWLCNGTIEEVETCSPVGTSLEEHLAEHRKALLAKAAELGCP